MINKVKIILRRIAFLLRRGAPFGMGVLAALVALLIYNALVPAPKPLTTREVKDTVGQVLASATPRPAYSSLVYRVIRPAFVLITTEGQEKDGKAQKGLGSGVIISDRGEILTSLHVVKDATVIHLVFADGTEATGEVLTSIEDKDIAVLAADQLPSVIVPAVLGNPGALREGDEVFAVGNPFGLYASISSGVISGFERTFKVPDSDVEIEGMIQFDAAVNPGNSGGPLLNRYGEVVGIVTGIANPTHEEVFIGIGFAVPIDVAGGAMGAPLY